MYGMVNRAVEEMVLIHYDDATWERIKAEAGVAEEEFMSHEAYPDEMTYRLVSAAAHISLTTFGSVRWMFASNVQSE